MKYISHFSIICDNFAKDYIESLVGAFQIYESELNDNYLTFKTKHTEVAFVLCKSKLDIRYKLKVENKNVKAFVVFV